MNIIKICGYGVVLTHIVIPLSLNWQSFLNTASNMIPEHLDALEAVFTRHGPNPRDEILIFRSVNPDAKRLIEQDFARPLSRT